VSARSARAPAAAPAVIPGQLDVAEVLSLVVADDGRATAEAVRGELVAPADELVDAFVLTLVASAQTQRTYERACRRFVRWPRAAGRARGADGGQRGPLPRPPGRGRPLERDGAQGPRGAQQLPALAGRA
jgi:hypothetical protein